MCDKQFIVGNNFTVVNHVDFIKYAKFLIVVQVTKFNWQISAVKSRSAKTLVTTNSNKLVIFL